MPTPEAGFSEGGRKQKLRWRLPPIAMTGNTEVDFREESATIDPE